MRNPGYRRRWAERFGFFPPVAAENSVWVHAVSVGEAQAAVPLIKWLMEQGRPVIVTTMTPTGSQRVHETFGGKVHHVYVPYDLPGAVQRFLMRARPSLAIIMETELWPNLFHACRERDIPVVLANARLSERSAAGYRWVAGLTRETLRHLSMIAAQSPADAEHLIALGAEAKHVRITGSIKFDVKLPASVREQAAVLRREWGDRPVWIAASTHEGEEEQVLDAMARVRLRVPRVLLVLVPRHPERFSKVEALCRKRGYKVSLRSQDHAVDAETAVFLGDTMGELLLFYAAGDVAFVGGSLVPTGGHNVLEPAGLEVPVIFGPYMFNFADIGRQLLEAGGARRVQDAARLAEAVVDFLEHPEVRRAMGQKGGLWVEQNRGALKSLTEIVGQYLESRS